MWRTRSVSMTRTWEHDRLTREIARTTGVSTAAWFRRLDRFGARAKGMVRLIEWLRDRKGLPQRLAATLAWNYFNPRTLPADVAAEVARPESRLRRRAA